MIPRLQMTEEKVNINMDVSSRLDTRQCTEPSIKFHNKRDEICSTETNILFQHFNTTTPIHHSLTFSVA